MTEPADDTELLGAWRAGDVDAGEALFERYFPQLYRFFAAKVPDAVDDLVQDTFLACVKGRGKIEDAAAFRGYVFGVARNVLFTHLRRRLRRPEVADVGLTSLADSGLPPSKRLADRVDRQLVGEALRRIPLDLQIPLELYYFEGFRGPEIARVLDVPEGTARSRIRRGLDEVRRVVDELQASPDALRALDATLTDWAAGLEAAGHDQRQ